MTRIDESEKKMHGYVSSICIYIYKTYYLSEIHKPDRFEKAREEVKEANPDNIPQIEQELREDAGCFKKILNGIAWFFKKLCQSAR